MSDNMRVHLKNLGPINEANININKVTIVGGHNATGKSTLSKFLYSFLRSNSYNREKIAYKDIVNLIREESRYIASFLRRNNHENYRNFNRGYFIIRNNEDFNAILDDYENIKNDFYNLDITNNDKKEVLEKFNQIDNLIDIVNQNDDSLYISLMRSLLESEFSTTNFNSLIEIIGINNSFKFIIDFKNHDFTSDDAFICKGGIILNDVYYIDSISILDMFDNIRFSSKKPIDHIDFLKKNLINNSNDTLNVFDDKINKNIIDLEKEIKSIINGNFIYENREFAFSCENGISSLMHNTASGIKQIGIIQLLLSNRKLKENCFLIIDEPEVNLHPDWQFKLANILMLLVKKLNVSIYINTHSPLFIEAINAFSEYYDLDDETNYYLAEKSDENELFNLNEVKSSELSKIYDNLGKPYFAIDQVRLEKELE